MTQTDHSKPLAEALARLQSEFPDATLTEVRLEFRAGERHDNGDPSRTWFEVSWRLQVGNDHGDGESFEEALLKLREEVSLRAMLPEQVERVAAVLRGLQGSYHDISSVVMRAQELVLQERRGQ